MADYSNSQTDPYEHAERRHGYAGLILTGIALLMLAALAWVWTQGSGAASATVAPAPVAVASMAAQSAPARPAQAAPQADSGALVPPSDAVAASGDTRAAR